jgi:hypothetical protein
MGKIERGAEGKLLVRVESEVDVGALRAALKASDGGDEVEVRVGELELDAENPFNYVALAATEFEWDAAALRCALECLAPVAQEQLRMGTRSHQRRMQRMLGEQRRERGEGS